MYRAGGLIFLPRLDVISAYDGWIDISGRVGTSVCGTGCVDMSGVTDGVTASFRDFSS